MFDDQSSRVEVRRTFDVGRSRFEVRHSRFEVVLVGGAPVHWWTFEGPGSRVQVRGSTFQVRVRARWGALVRGSRVNGRGSRVEVRHSTFDIRASRFEIPGLAYFGALQYEGRLSRAEGRLSRVEDLGGSTINVR